MTKAKIIFQNKSKGGTASFWNMQKNDHVCLKQLSPVKDDFFKKSDPSTLVVFFNQ